MTDATDRDLQEANRIASTINERTHKAPHGIANMIASALAAARATAGGVRVGWRQAKDGQQFYDGDVIVCAVALASGGFDFACVHLRVDEGRFEMDVEGDAWGWTWDDVTWWIPAKELAASIISPCPSPPREVPDYKAEAMAWREWKYATKHEPGCADGEACQACNVERDLEEIFSANRAAEAASAPAQKGDL